MPYNPKLSMPVSAYIDPALIERMKKVRKLKPRLSMSHQINYALERTIGDLEAAAKKVAP